MDEAEKERQKKLEAGKLKLARFQNKRKAAVKNKTSPNTSTPSTPSSMSETSLVDSVKDEGAESTESSDLFDWSSTDGLNDLKACGRNIGNLQAAIVQRDHVIAQLTSRLQEEVKIGAERDTKLAEMVHDIEHQRQQVGRFHEIILGRDQKISELFARLTDESQKERDICHAEVQVGMIEPTTVEKCVQSSILGVETFVQTFTDNHETAVQVNSFDLLDVRDDSEIVNQLNSECSSIEKLLFDRYHSVVMEKNILEQKLAKLNDFASPSINEGYHEESSLTSSLQRIICINNIARTVNYLLQGLSNISEQSSLQHTKSESDEFTIDLLNGPTPAKTINSNGSFGSCIELLRNEEFSENLSNLKDFLLKEMSQSYTQFSSNLGESRLVDNLSSAGECVNIVTEASFQLSAEMAAQQRANFEVNVQHLSEWVDNIHSPHDKSSTAPELDVSPEFVPMISDELPLSCVSLVSLTDSERFEVTESWNENVPYRNSGQPDDNKSLPPLRLTSSGNNLYTIREESIDDQFMVSKYEELKAQHEEEVKTLKAYLEEDYRREKEVMLKRISQLENQNQINQQASNDLQSQFEEKLRLAKKELEENYKSLEVSSREDMNRLKNIEGQFESFRIITEDHHRVELSQIQSSHTKEKNELLVLVNELKEKLRKLDVKVLELEDEKLKMQTDYSNQIADLVADHGQDLENVRQNLYSSHQEKQILFENDHKCKVEELKERHLNEIRELEHNIHSYVQEETHKIRDEHKEILSSLTTKHTSEITDCQKKIETLLEEKCQLLDRSRDLYERVVKENQRALQELCHIVESQIYREKEKIEASKSGDVSLESTFVEVLDELHHNIRSGIDVVMKQKPVSREDLNLVGETKKEKDGKSSDTIPVELHELRLKDMQRTIEDLKLKQQVELDNWQKQLEGHTVEESILEQMQNMKLEFVEQLTLLKKENQQLDEELQEVHKKLCLLEDTNAKLQNEKRATQLKLQESCEELESPAVREDIAGLISSNDVYNISQMNSRLLHVLSVLVKTFLEIERDINSRLTEYGLNSSHSEGLFNHDDDAGQSVGSREDFTGIGLSDNVNLELHEDGPDLTPRTWNIVKSMGEYDADAEDEDVVIGASRRVRSQIDHVLQLLSLVFDKSKEQDFKALLRRNEELSQELNEECSDRNNMQMLLLNAESRIRKLEGDKQKIEDENFQLCSDKEAILRELPLLKSKLSQLEDQKEKAFEEKKQLQVQLDVLASRLGDPEKTCKENWSRDVPELLEENSKLSAEKLSMQKSLSKERQTLSSRVQQLELSLEEAIAQKDDIVEKSRHAIEDLRCQLESAEKQLFSNKKFMDEQAFEREQEREDHFKEIKKLNDIMREKDKIQSIESQHTKEAENLERQLRTKIEEHAAVVSKKEDLERDLRQSLDKIQDLREVIVELEKQIETKNHSERNLKMKLNSAIKSISTYEKSNEDLKYQLEEFSNSLHQEESTDKLRSLEEQLASKSQELTQLSQSEMLLQELRGQIHFLDSKVDQKTRHVESLHLVSMALSPVLSDDPSHSESQDGDHYPVQCKDGWEMSPRSIHWQEIRRLEEKISRLILIEEELIKQNKDMTVMLNKMRDSEEELLHERTALQKQTMDQYMQISALTTQIDELRHRVQFPISTQSITEVENLRELLENEQEQRKRSSHDILDLKHKVHELELNIQDKNKLIEKLRNESEAHVIRFSKMTQTDLSEISVVMSTPKTDSFLPPLWQKLSEEKNKEIESLNNQLKNLQEELEQTRKALKLSPDVCRTCKNLQHKLLKTAKELETSKERASSILARMMEMEAEMIKIKTDTEIEKVQLEHDFDTIQSMMEKKEKEISILQEENENQVRLEAEIDILHRKLIEQEHLKGQIEKLQNELESIRATHSRDVKEWEMKSVEVVQSYESKLAVLRQQISVLKSKFLNAENDEDIDLKEVQKKISNAAMELKDGSDESQNIFNEVVLHILKQAVDLKLKSLNVHHNAELVEVEKTWRQTLLEKTEEVKRFGEEQTRKEVTKLKRKFAEEFETARTSLEKEFADKMEQLSKDKDSFWQKKLEELHSALQHKNEVINKLMSRGTELKKEFEKKIEEVESSLKDTHDREIAQLKSDLTEATTRNDSDLEVVKALHEKEKLILLKECENKWFTISQLLKSKFDKGKENIETTYKSQLLEMQKVSQTLLEEERKKWDKEREDELNTIHAKLEQKWEEKVQMFREFHQNEIQTVKDTKEKNTEEILCQLCISFENKLRDMQAECETQFAEQRRLDNLRQQAEFDKAFRDQQEKFEKERLVRERQVRTELHQKYEREYLEKLESQELKNLESKMKTLEENWQKKMSILKKKLELAHQKELATIKQNYEMQIMMIESNHNETLRTLQEKYNRELKATIEAIKASWSTNSMHRTSLSEDVTSSDETGDSSTSVPVKALQKIQGYGIQTLALMKNLPESGNGDSTEVQLLRGELAWAISKLQSVLANEANGENTLKALVEKIVQELEFMRSSLQSFTNHNNMQAEQIWELKKKLNSENVEFSEKIEKQAKLIAWLENASKASNEDSAFQRDNQRNGTDIQLSKSEVASNFASVELARATADTRSVNFSTELQGIHDPPSAWFKSTNGTKMTSTPKYPSNFQEEECKRDLMKVSTPKKDQTSATKIHSLFWKYQRTRNQRKALVYQKQYLLLLLSEYQGTEAIVIAMLDKMGMSIAKKNNTSVASIAEDRPKGRTLFRSAAFVIIAIYRIKFWVKRWHREVSLSRSHLSFKDIEFGSPRTLCSHVRTCCSSSISMSTSSNEDNRRPSSSHTNSASHAKGHLSEYVDRLDLLHRRLGLSDHDNS